MARIRSRRELGAIFAKRGGRAGVPISQRIRERRISEKNRTTMNIAIGADSAAEARREARLYFRGPVNVSSIRPIVGGYSATVTGIRRSG